MIIFVVWFIYFIVKPYVPIKILFNYKLSNTQNSNNTNALVFLTNCFATFASDF